VDEAQSAAVSGQRRTAMKSRSRLISVGFSNLPHQYGDLYRGPELEAQALIQCDCRVVGHPCVKEWLVAALLDGVRDDR
jgi:hypothetical protein